MSQLGPKLTLLASCAGCDLARGERYYYQNDTGIDVYCQHEDAPVTQCFDKEVHGFVGDSTWDTPRWCPLLAAARTAFLAEVQS